MLFHPWNDIKVVKFLSNQIFFVTLPHKVKQKTPTTMADLKLLTIDDLYITPFTARRVYSEDGVISWVPVERKLNPTGVSVIDFVVRSMSEGHCDFQWMAQRLLCKRRDVRGLVSALTGMDADAFLRAYMFRLADDLLRYTDMSINEVAKRAGFTSASRMAHNFTKHRHITPKEQRRVTQRDIDKGRFRL